MTSATSLMRLAGLVLVLTVTGWGQPLVEFAHDYEHDLAFSVYMKGEKIGYLTSQAEVSADGRQLKIHNGDLMDAMFAGQATYVRTESLLYFSLEDGSLTSFRKSEDGDGENLVWSGQSAHQGFEIVTETPSSRASRIVPEVEEDLLGYQRLAQWLRTASLGEQLTLYEAEWDKDDINVPTTYTLINRGQRLLSGVKVDTFEVEMVSDGLRATGVLDRLGLPLSIDVGGLMTIVREPKEQALKMEAEKVEILTSSGVQLDRRLGQDITRVELLAQNLGDYRFPEAGFQQVVYLPTGSAYLTLEAGATTSQTAGSDYLKATPTVQTDLPQLRSLLDLLELDGKTDREKVELLNRYVYRVLDKAYSQNASTTEGVLENMAGDCTEHSLLLISLLRASGIPARPLSGLVYAGDELQTMNHHVWVEAYVDQAWLAVDPSFDQVPADAGRILLDRDDQMSGFQIAGHLELSVAASHSTLGSYRHPAPFVVLALLSLGLLVGLIVVMTVTYGATRNL